MRKNILLKVLSFFGKVSLLQAILFTLFTKSVSAQVTSPWSGKCVDNGVATIGGIECVVANILNIGISFIGLASAVMFFVGSILYLTSGGVPKGTEAAKNTITYAIIGLLVAISGWVILNFISVFTGNQIILKFGFL